MGARVSLACVERRFPTKPDGPVLHREGERIRGDRGELESVVVGVWVVAKEADRAVPVRDTSEVGDALARSVVEVGDGVDAFEHDGRSTLARSVWPLAHNLRPAWPEVRCERLFRIGRPSLARSYDLRSYPAVPSCPAVQ